MGRRRGLRQLLADDAARLRVDLAGLLPQRERIADYTDVLNGIAYDPKTKRLFVTGKLWPKVFEIRIEPKPIRR